MAFYPKAHTVLKNFGESPHRHAELVEKLDSQFGTGGMFGTNWHIDLSHGVHVHNHNISGWDGWIPGNMLNEFMDGTYPPKSAEVALPAPPPILPPPPIVFRPMPTAGRKTAAPKFVEPATPPEDNGYDFEELGDGFKCLHCGHILKTEKGIRGHVEREHR